MIWHSFTGTTGSPGPLQSLGAASPPVGATTLLFKDTCDTEFKCTVFYWECPKDTRCQVHIRCSSGLSRVGLWLIHLHGDIRASRELPQLRTSWLQVNTPHCPGAHTTQLHSPHHQAHPAPALGKRLSDPMNMFG